MGFWPPFLASVLSDPLRPLLRSLGFPDSSLETSAVIQHPLFTHEVTKARGGDGVY